MQGAHHLKCAHDTEDAVKPSAHGLRVDMGSGHYRCEVAVLTGPFAEDISHFINCYFKIQILQPSDEKIPCLPVFIR